MANTYTWVINSLECYPNLNGKQNVIFSVYYYVVATDGTNTVSCNGNQPLIYVEGSPFTDYSSLTKEQVITWLQEAVGENQITAIQDALDVQLNGLANPITIKPSLPW
jgi:hypothetical protein